MTKPTQKSPVKGTVDRSLVVPIVANAALAGPVADGRLIPVLILDTSARPAVAEVIRVHEHLAGGDASSTWASSRDNPDHVMLLMAFTRPIEVELVLLFSIEHEAILVETMLTAGATYLQTGKTGDRLMSTLDAPRVLVELPDVGFRPHWDDLLLNRMTTVMAGRLGLPRRKGRPAAKAVIVELRKLAQFRMAQ